MTTDYNMSQVQSEIDDKINNAVDGIVSAVNTTGKAINGMLEYKNMLNEKKNNLLQEISFTSVFSANEVEELEEEARKFAFSEDPDEDYETQAKKAFMRSTIASIDVINETIENIEMEILESQKLHRKIRDDLYGKRVTLRRVMMSIESLRNRICYLNALIDTKTKHYLARLKQHEEEKEEIKNDRELSEHERKLFTTQINEQIREIIEIYERDTKLCHNLLEACKTEELLEQDIIDIGLLAEYRELRRQMMEGNPSDQSLIRIKMAAIECEKIQRKIYELQKLLETDLSPEERRDIESQLAILQDSLRIKMKDEGVRALGTKIVHTDPTGKMFFMNPEGEKVYRLAPDRSQEYILDVSVAILHFLQPKIRDEIRALIEPGSEEGEVTPPESLVGAETEEYTDRGKVGEPIVQGLVDCVKHQPPDPVDHLAHFLMFWCTNRTIKEYRMEIEMQLKKERHKLAIVVMDNALPNNQPFADLKCSQAFGGLTLKEKLYAHFMSQACWYGSLISIMQSSPEAPLIFSLLHRIFLSEPWLDLKQRVIRLGITEQEFQAFVVYASGVFSYFGNYKTFGDDKIVPNMNKDVFEQIVKASKAFSTHAEIMENLWKRVEVPIFSLTEREKVLGLCDKGVTKFFSANCTLDDAEFVSEWMSKKHQEAYLTRTFKYSDKQGRTVYEIRLASVLKDHENGITFPEEEYKNAIFKITRGDFSKILNLITFYLRDAIPYASNDRQKFIIQKYISGFEKGSLRDHKSAAKNWINDKYPTVETNIGFIERFSLIKELARVESGTPVNSGGWWVIELVVHFTKILKLENATQTKIETKTKNNYLRDPVGQRGQFIGFVAMVNKDTSSKFSKLLEQAEKFLLRLPWGKNFDKDSFAHPDFTSMEVLTYVGSEVPAGVNLPNYDDILETEGFKNISLNNVLTSGIDPTEIRFVSKADSELLTKYRVKSFEVQVGLHELLGHGSGKLFRRDENGKYNFDTEQVKNPITSKPIESWYEPGETYESKFPVIGVALEECRAEAVGLYLCLNKDIMKVFGYTGTEADDIIYAIWLNLIWSAIAKGLEMYSPERKKWLQAHSQARYVIMNLLLQSGEGLLEVRETKPNRDLLVTLNRNKIQTVGKRELSSLLLLLQVYKSTGDIQGAKDIFSKFSDVPETGLYPFGRWRKIILSTKLPRKIFVQSNTYPTLNKDDVVLKTYESSATGCVQSWIDRFPNTTIDDILEELWESDSIHFQK